MVELKRTAKNGGKGRKGSERGVQGGAERNVDRETATKEGEERKGKGEEGKDEGFGPYQLQFLDSSLPLFVLVMLWVFLLVVWWRHCSETSLFHASTRRHSTRPSCRASGAGQCAEA